MSHKIRTNPRELLEGIGNTILNMKPGCHITHGKGRGTVLYDSCVVLFLQQTLVSWEAHIRLSYNVLQYCIFAWQSSYISEQSHPYKKIKQYLVNQ